MKHTDTGIPAAFTDYRQPIVAMITQVLDEIEADLPVVSPHARWALAVLRDYSLRDSKRVRGTLAAALYDDMMQTHHDRRGVRLAAAIELVQNYLLIVDDAMDHSALRRGQPTAHELYKSRYGVDDAHEAGMVGILVGMITQHISNLALLNSEAEAMDTLAAMQVIQRHTLITGFGQIDDMQQMFGRTFTPDDLRRKYEQKSSYYSFVSPLQSALALAGRVGPEIQTTCEAVGLPAGVAFQMRDDYLGLFGAPEQTGKPNLDDLREGKHTFLIDALLRRAGAAERRTLQRILGSPQANEVDLADIQQMIRASGALDEVEHDMQALAAEAVAAVQASTIWSQDFAALLVWLINFSIQRQK